MSVLLLSLLAWADCPADLLDPFEPNDVSQQAAALGLGSDLDLGVCSAFPDYFQIYLTQGATFHAEALYDQILGSINLSLLSVGGQVIATANGSAGLAHLETEVTIGGDHYLLAELASGPTEGLAYALSVFESDVNQCFEDQYEPNQSPNQTALLTGGSHADLHVCIGDSDWYSIYLNASERIDVDVSFSHSEGDIDISLMDPTGQHAESSISQTDNESLSFIPIVEGAYVLNVQLVNETDADFGVGYAIDVELTQLAVCSDDAYEENDYQNQAVFIDIGSHLGLSACDDDWYSVDVSAGDLLTIELTFDHALGDIDLSLYDPSGAWLDSASGSSNVEQISHQASTTGTYQFNVRLFGDDEDIGNAYDMSLTVEEQAQEQSPESSADSGAPPSEPSEDESKESGCQTLESSDFGLVLLAFVLLLIHSRNRQENIS